MTPNPDAFLQLVQSIFFTAGGIGAIIGIFVGIKSLARKPPFEAEFATKHELEKIRSKQEMDKKELESEIKTAIGSVGTEVKDLIQDHYKTAEVNVKGIHKRVDLILARIYWITGRCQAFHGGDQPGNAGMNGGLNETNP